MKEQWDSGVGEQEGVLAGFGGVQRGLRQHEVKKAADGCHRIVDRQRDT